MSSLTKIIKKYYEENSRYEAGPPIRLIKGLEQGNLLLCDVEISDEDIAVLTRFFENRKAFEQIKRIEINRTSGGKVNKRRTNSALNCNGHKLFKDLLEFIGKCTQLEVLTFEKIELEMSIIRALGKALITTSSPLRWLTFRCCALCGDEGLQELTPFLGKLQLQVLAFEHCELTDGALPFISSILKAQQNLLDSLFWNTTLRVDPEEQTEERVEENKSLVCSQGLVALSLLGNKISSGGLPAFSKLLRSHKWLLGLNLAENEIDTASMTVLVDQLVANQMLLAVCLRNNMGLTSSQSTTLSHSILHKWRGEESRFSKGEARCKFFPPALAMLLKNWMRLQLEETTDLIDSRTLASRSVHAPPKKALTGENAQESYLLNYSVLSALHEKPFSPHPVLAQRYSHESTEGRYSAGERQRMSEADEMELFFRPSVASPLPLRRGAEYDESVDASVDRDRSRSTQGRRGKKESNSRRSDDFDAAIGVSPPRGRRSESDAFDGWDYRWPAEKESARRIDQRPPSRDSLRPKRIDAWDDDRDRHERLRERERVREKSGPSRERRSLSRPRTPEPIMKPRPAWMPSSFVPETNEALRRRAAALGQRAVSPMAATQRRKPDLPVNTHNNNQNKTPKRRSSLPSKPAARRKSIPARHTSPMRVSAPKSPVMDEIASSVLMATRNLEYASKRLLNVAESLSESAMMNISHLSHQDMDPQASSSPVRSARSTPERQAPVRIPTQPSQMQPQTPSQQLLADLEVENLQFADIVRQRMKSKLRDYLEKELLSPM